MNEEAELPEITQDWPTGQGEMAARIRAFDWSSTSLGPMAKWPAALRTMLQAVLELPQPASMCWGREALLLYNDGYREILCDKHPGALGVPLTQAWPELTEVIGVAVDAVMAGTPQCWIDVPFELEGRGEGTRTGWFSASWAPVRDAEGAIGGFQMIATETTREHETRKQLETREARQRFELELSDALREESAADAIIAAATRLLGERLQAMRVVYAEIDEEAGVARIRPGWTAAGEPVHPAELRLTDFGGPLLDDLRAGRTVMHEDVGVAPDRPDLKALAAIDIQSLMSVPLLKGGRFVVNLNVHDSRPRRWGDEDLALIEAVAERTWAAVERAQAEAAVRDRERRLRTVIEELQEARDRQQVLLGELQHRVRNILAVVRSVFSRTVGSATDLEDAADHFRGRLDSLARTQVMTTRGADTRADLEDLIRDELLSVGAGDGPLVTIAGPDVELSPGVAETLGMAIHELTTNALKYGALKVAGAQLNISWRVDADCGGARQLHLTWTEQGVPAVTLAPARYGFGSELILEAMPYRLRAETELEFRGGGVRCTITLPLV